MILAGFLKTQPAPKAEQFNENLHFHQKFPSLSGFVGKLKTLKLLYSTTQTVKVDEKRSNLETHLKA